MKPSKAIKTLQKALDQMRQESANLQKLGRALTSEEKTRVKSLTRSIDLAQRALEALE